jgi:hypothetical protein
MVEMTNPFRKEWYLKMSKFIVLCLVVITLLPALALAVDPDPRGLILVSSRKLGYVGAGGEGPTVGDVSMLVLLQNAGYRGKVAPDNTLDVDIAAAQVPGETLEMVVISGSSSSSDVMPVPPGIPVMMGEHVTLNDDTKVSWIPFYSKNGSSGDSNRWPGDANKTQYMKIINTTHPITQGIQTDANGMVKILRDPYPTEDTYCRPDPSIDSTNPYKHNYEFGWPNEPISSAAPGLTILAVSPLDENLAVFAVLDQGAIMANGAAASARYVHFFVNENGSGGTRRRFNALNETGRLLFVRAAQWAMGDPLSEPGASEVENWNLY